MADLAKLFGMPGATDGNADVPAPAPYSGAGPSSSSSSALAHINASPSVRPLIGHVAPPPMPTSVAELNAAASKEDIAKQVALLQAQLDAAEEEKKKEKKEKEKKKKEDEKKKKEKEKEEEEKKKKKEKEDEEKEKEKKAAAAAKKKAAAAAAKKKKKEEEDADATEDDGADAEAGGGDDDDGGDAATTTKKQKLENGVPNPKPKGKGKGKGKGKKASAAAAAAAEEPGAAAAAAVPTPPTATVGAKRTVNGEPVLRIQEQAAVAATASAPTISPEQVLALQHKCRGFLTSLTIAQCLAGEKIAAIMAMQPKDAMTAMTTLFDNLDDPKNRAVIHAMSAVVGALFPGAIRATAAGVAAQPRVSDIVTFITAATTAAAAAAAGDKLH